MLSSDCVRGSDAITGWVGLELGWVEFFSFFRRAGLSLTVDRWVELGQRLPNVTVSSLSQQSLLHTIHNY